ncbi:MAG: hypothetical protein WAU78_07825 [Roseiarcus sp.]
MGIRDCIGAALDRGAITREEAEFLNEKAKAFEETDGQAAKAAFGDRLRAEELERRRVELLSATAAGAIYSDVRRFARLWGRADVVKAFYALFENFGSGFQSFRSIRSALLSQSLSGMNDFMHAFRRNVAMKRLNRPLLDDVIRGLHGENVSDVAKALGQSWSKVAEKLRAMFNAAGGHIGELKDWAVPQSHDAGALLRAGFDAWRAFIEPRLDWDRIKRPATGLTVPPGERRGLLRGVYDSVVSDGWNRRDPSLETFGKGALYNQRDDGRFLHFKNADAWLEYSRRFGAGGPYAALIDHISGLTRDVAMMKRFGPNPAAMVEWLKQVVASEAGKFKSEQPSMFRGQSGQTADFTAKKAAYMLDGFHDAARGSSMPFSRTGAAIAMFRDLEYSAKLGSAVVLHAITNPIIQAMGRYLQGHSLVTLPLELAKGFTRGEADEAGLILDDALVHLESGAREQSAWMKAREVTRWLPSATTHWSGLDAVRRASRRSAFMGQMSTYGKVAGKEFADLPARIRDGLQGFGIEAKAWDAIRAAPYDAESGHPLLRPQDIADPEAALAYRGLLHGQAEALVPSSNLHIQAATAFANRSPLGKEVVKSALEFKSGFLATLWLTQWQQIERELTRNGRGAAGAYLAASAIALTAGGLLALQLKQIAAGKDPLAMDADSRDGATTWGRAFMTSGALGIYGDFLASEFSSYGHGLTETLAGPTVTGAADIADSAKKAGQRALAWATGAKPPAGSEEDDALKALRNNTPMLSTHWALRAAFNRVILDQLAYMTDPRAHQAMRATEQRVKKDTNQGFFWPPGELTPDRAPEFTMGR